MGFSSSKRQVPEDPSSTYLCLLQRVEWPREVACPGPGTIRHSQRPSLFPQEWAGQELQGLALESSLGACCLPELEWPQFNVTISPRRWSGRGRGYRRGADVWPIVAGWAMQHAHEGPWGSWPATFTCTLSQGALSYCWCVRRGLPAAGHRTQGRRVLRHHSFFPLCWQL